MIKPLCRVFVGVFLAGLSMSGMADTNAVSNATTMAEVVVTASGVEEAYQTLPVTISTVSTEDAQRIRPLWIGELLNEQAGVAAFQLRGAVDTFSIRQPVRYDNVNLYLQDNVPLQSPIGFNHAAFSYSSALTSPGGIEVLKGPGTALHGSDAFSGVINIKSLEPDFSGRETDIHARAGMYGLIDVGVEDNEVLSDNNAFRFSFSHQEEEGWRDTSDWRREQFLGRNTYTSDDKDLTIKSIVTVTDFDSAMAAALDKETFLNNPESDGLDAGVNRDDARDKEQYFRYSAEISKDLTEADTLMVTPYVRYIDQEYLTTWEPDTTPIVNSQDETIGALSKFYHRYDGGAETVYGFDVTETSFEFFQEQVRPDATVWGTLYPQGVNYDYDVDYSSLAPFIQHDQPLSERVTASVGLRFESSEYDFHNNLTEVAGDADDYLQLEDRTDEFEQWNPKAGLAYALNDQDTVYARYAHGFRIPTSEELYTLRESQTSFSLDPETINSYEVGYKGLLADRVKFDVTGFYLRTEDGVATGVSTPAGDISENGGETEFYGAEFTAAMPLGEQFDANVNFTAQQSHIIKEFASMEGAGDGNEAAGTPATLGNLRLGYRPVWQKKFRGEVGVQHLGSWYLDNANTLKTDNEFIVNLRGDYAVNENVMLDLKVQNVFDELYAETAEAPDWAPDGIYRPGQPITVSAGATMRF